MVPRPPPCFHQSHLGPPCAEPQVAGAGAALPALSPRPVTGTLKRKGSGRHKASRTQGRGHWRRVGVRWGCREGASGGRTLGQLGRHAGQEPPTQASLGQAGAGSGGPGGGLAQHQAAGFKVRAARSGRQDGGEEEGRGGAGPRAQRAEGALPPCKVGASSPLRLWLRRPTPPSG